MGYTRMAMDISSQNLIRELFQSHPLPSFVFNPQGEVLMINQAGEDMLRAIPGIRLETGESSFLTAIHRDQRLRFEAHLVECVSRSHAELKDLRMGHDDDSPLWLRLNSVCISPPPGKAQASGEQRLILSSGVNVSESRRNQDALLLARNQAEKARKQQSVFLGQISHEIQSPLKDLSQISDLLREAVQEERLKSAEDLSQTIGSISKNLGTIVNDLLDLSLMDENKLELRSRPFSLPEVLDELEKLNRPLAEKRGLGFYVRKNMSTEGIFQGDERRIRQVLNILITNALEYTEEGQVDIILREDELSDYLSEISIEVRDTGAGIPPRIHHELWEGIYSEKEHGTGVGLPIAKRLTRLMRGQIYFETARNIGTSFFFTIPLTRFTGDSNLKILEARQNRLKNLRILAGISRGSSWQGLLSSLGEDGHMVVSSHDGSEVASLLELNTFDVILLDSYPEMVHNRDVADKISESVHSEESFPVLIQLGVGEANSTANPPRHILPPNSSSLDLYRILTGIL